MTALETMTIAFCGDFMISRRPTAGEIERATALFSGVDVVVANVDSVLSDEGTPVPKWANLRGPRAAAADLRAMGIDVAVLANNHAMDFRGPGLLDMMASFDEVGIATVGAGTNLIDATKPCIVERNGVKVSLLAFASTLPVESAASDNRPGIAPVRARYAFEVDESLATEQPGSVPNIRSWVDPVDLQRVQTEIRAAAGQSDGVVVIAHWGVPSPWRAFFQPTVLEYQRQLGRAMIEAGALAVIGNHPHELHGIELIDGRPVAYSIGNFWIDTLPLYGWMGREAIVLNLIVTKGGADSTITADPIMLSGDGLPALDESSRTFDVLNRHSAEFGVWTNSRSRQVQPVG
jgi:poly-gamma-glutamate capsule biosynthesis protein CapA/YwtB (metallophosphatase superfamily)